MKVAGATESAAHPPLFACNVVMNPAYRNAFGPATGACDQDRFQGRSDFTSHCPFFGRQASPCIQVSAPARK